MEVADTIKIDFAWTFLIKAFLLGLLTYFIWPLVFIFRSLLATLVIEKWIMNKKFEVDFRVYCCGKLEINYLPNKWSYLIESGPTPIYRVENSMVTKEFHDTINKRVNEIHEEMKRLEPGINRRNNLTKWVIQHFKLEHYTNSIMDRLDFIKEKATDARNETDKFFDSFSQQSITGTEYTDAIAEKVLDVMIQRF